MCMKSNSFQSILYLWKPLGTLKLVNQPPHMHILPVSVQDLTMMTWVATILCEYRVLPVGVSLSPLTQLAAVTGVLGYSGCSTEARASSDLLSVNGGSQHSH